MAMILGPDGEPFDPYYDLVDETDEVDQEIGPAEVEQMLRDLIASSEETLAIAAPRDRPRTKAQRLIGKLLKACLEEGEHALGLSIGLLSGARAFGHQDMYLEVILNTWHQLRPQMRRCRVCGCTDDRACPGGCEWVEFDLCSRCV